MAIQFGWGGVIFGMGNENYSAFSHDEWMVVYSREAQSILSASQKFGFDEVFISSNSGPETLQ
jgi:hypothetical protein